MSKSKDKGTRWETAVARYYANVLADDRIERRTLRGVSDCGDIAGLRWRGKRVVVECKNCRKVEIRKWLDEANEERGNDDAELGVVALKLERVGLGDVGSHAIIMSGETFAAILAGGHDLLEDADENIN